MQRKSGTAFIGAGAMATAIVRGMLKGGFTRAGISAFDVSRQATAKFQSATGIKAAESAAEALRGAETVVVAVKPQHIREALEGLKGILGSRLLISIAAGIRLESLQSLSGAKRTVRVMPNTPALVGEGISVFCAPESLASKDFETVKSIFGSVGKVCQLEERLMDAVTALSGSGPAYVFDFIQALTDAGVHCGIPRETASLLAAQTVFGSAKLLMETGEHPSLLREKVTSPGGTTASALRVLEKNGFKGIIIDAVAAAAERSHELGRH